MKTLFVTALFLLTHTAVLAQTPESPQTVQSADAVTATEKVAPKPITFLDSKLFDNMLSKELSVEKDVVEVAISGKMSLNNIPARIDKWISLVAENGEVQLVATEPALKPKFVMGLLSLIPTVYSYFKKTSEERTLEPAKKYNATIIYQLDKNGESIIEKIVFTRRK
jgi:hypothetical protein